MAAAAHQRGLDSTPICRCRVLYLGSAVPHVTKDGLQGIQEPLRELYPEQGAIGAKGIDSWLSVWSNGLLLENVDENHKKVSRFFPIDTLHYCAAVRYVLVPEKSSVSSSSSSQPRFLPLDSPFARSPNPSHPPLFAAILRRTTGIKVLECHTFICKREMAANALVRCCFHAYADSSYARHIDSGGGNSNSVYGTLRDYDRPPALPVPTSSIEKVEGWNRMGSASGSMLTLNGAGLQSTLDRGNHRGTVGSNAENENSIDDISIYNGDENHKIWAGSTRDISSTDRDYIYGECGGSTMRSTRSIRPRQVMNAPPPPPPPVKEEKKKTSKDKAKRKKATGLNREEMYPTMNGSPMRPGTSQGISGMRPHSSLSGTMMKGATVGRMNNMHPKGTILRPASSHLSYRRTPPPVIMVPTTLPHPRRAPVGTFPHHHPPKGGIMVPVRPHMPPNFIPLPPHPMYLQAGRKPPRHYQVAMEEPIYMPSARPLSPVASYQPSHFPHEAYLMQQYATLYNNSKKKDKHGKKTGPIGMNGDYVQDEEEESGETMFNAGGYHHKKGKKGKERAQSVNGDIHHHHHHHHNQEEEEDDDEDGDGESRFNSARIYRKKSKEMKNGRRKSSPGANEDQDDDEDGGSPFDTGIYRRKGHLNERAFSYSIRQEHRSRSYGSLANLKFASPPIVSNGSSSGGGGPPQEPRYYDGSVNKEEMKKEREIMQMMQDLELTGDELERIEVPAGVYRQQVMQHPTKLRR